MTAQDLAEYLHELDLAERTIRHLIENDELPEPERARIHALTRTVRMSDAELEQIADSIANESDNACLAVLRNIRDRYESLGEYAPAAQEVKP